MRASWISCECYHLCFLLDVGSFWVTNLTRATKTCLRRLASRLQEPQAEIVVARKQPACGDYVEVLPTSGKLSDWVLGRIVGPLDRRGYWPVRYLNAGVFGKQGMRACASVAEAENRGSGRSYFLPMLPREEAAVRQDHESSPEWRFDAGEAEIGARVQLVKIRPGCRQPCGQMLLYYYSASLCCQLKKRY